MEPTETLLSVKKTDAGLLLFIVTDLLTPNYLVRIDPYWQKVIIWAFSTVIVALYIWRTKTPEEFAIGFKGLGFLFASFCLCFWSAFSSLA